MVDKTSKLYELWKLNVENLYKRCKGNEITQQLSSVDVESRFEMIKIEPGLLKYLGKDNFTQEIIDWVIDNYENSISLLRDDAQINLTDDMIKEALKYNGYQITSLEDPSDELVMYGLNMYLRQRKAMNPNLTLKDLEWNIGRLIENLYAGKTYYTFSDKLLEFFINKFKSSKNILYKIMKHCNVSQLEALPDELKLWIELKLDDTDADTND